MKNNLHSEKEILIFNGVMKLMNEGVNLYTIKVEDIAKTVGIGKGTVYEYFKSKDEILEKSLIYCMNLCMDKALEKINQENGFREKIYTILEITKCNIQEFNSGNSLLFSNMGFSEFAHLINSDHKELKVREETINNTIKNIISIGIEEKVIQNQGDREYESMVLKSAVIGFANAIYCSNSTIETDIDKIKDRTYKLLIKGLN